jgi:hypothetical protein
LRALTGEEESDGVIRVSHVVEIYLRPR